MNYERLELTDFVDKWDAAKVKHLEDGIVANEEAIERYHNDSVVEMQADWAQDDETAKDYVKNRTHYIKTVPIPIVKDFKTEVYEYTYTEDGYEYTDIRLTNRYIPSNVVLNSIEEIEKVTIYINGCLCEAKPNYKVLSQITWFLEKGMSLRYSKGTWSLDLDSKNPDVVIGEEYIININTKQVQYVPIDEKYLPESMKRQADWSCNTPSDKAYIKNRTHYDYWKEESRIYDLPYTFEFTSADSSNWLGDYGFIYNECLFNSDSDWVSDGEEYDEILEVWKDKYKCSQVQNEKVLTLKAITYSQWNSETDEYNHITTIDCEGEGSDIVELYMAKRYSKTIDKRFLPDLSLSIPQMDWNENRENDVRYIKNRTHYLYSDLDTLVKHSYWEFDGENEQVKVDTLLPYEQIIETDLSEKDGAGYWLGRFGGYHLRHSGGGYNSTVDAYSNWELREVNNNVTSYYYLGFYVDVELIEPRKYRVVLTHASADTEAYEVYTLGPKYKKLDDIYLSDNIARTSEVVTSINGQTGDVSLPLDDFVNRDALKEYVKGEPVTTYEWEEIGSNIHHEDEHITLTKPINLDKFNIKLVSSAGEEDLIPWSEKNYIISRKPDGSYILLYTGGVKNNSSVYELRISGMIDGSGETYVSYVEMVTPDATLSIYIENEIISYQTVPETSIPDSIARKRDIPKIDYPVTSVNGQTGDVVISKSWNDLQDKPFEDASVVILPTTPLMYEEWTTECFDFSPIVGGEYTLVVDGVEYKTTCLESEFIEYMFPLYSDNSGGNAIFYESSDGRFSNYLTDFGYDKRIYISLRRDNIKEIDEKFIPNTIARAPKATLSYITETPTAEQYNAVLDVLKEAGILV